MDTNPAEEVFQSHSFRVFLSNSRFFPKSSPTMADDNKRRVMFVCLGNICRSPMAEAVFKEVARQKGVAHKWHAESAGLGDWHVGCSPDHRTMAVLRENGIQFEHSAQQLIEEHFYDFEFIIGMDHDNIVDIKYKKPKMSKAKVELLCSFDEHGGDSMIIRDPFYDSDNRGFKKCYEQCLRSCKGFFDKYE